MNEHWDYAMACIETEWPDLLGEAYNTLNLLSPGKSIDNAPEFLIRMFHPQEILKNKDKRNIILKVLSEEYLRELSDRVFGKNELTPYQRVNQLKEVNYNKRVESIFLDYFGIQPIQKHNPTVIIGQELIDSSQLLYPLRGYQKQILDDVEDLFNKNGLVKRCLIQMPTGSGKTRTTMYYISEQMNHEQSYMVLWLAYSKELCDQAADEFSHIWPIRGNCEMSLYRFYGNSSCQFPEHKINGIVITTLKKLLEARKKKETLLSRMADKIDLVIFDEAHQIIADTYRSIVTDLIDLGDAKLIGLTATPGRTWNDPAEDSKLSDFFHRNIVCINTGSGESPNAMLTKEGYLSRIIWRECDYNSGSMSEDELNVISQLRDEDDLPIDFLNKISMDAKRNVRIINEIKQLLDEGRQRILVFSASVQHSKVLSSILNVYFGNECIIKSVDGNTPQGDRDSIIEEFRLPSKKAQILCNYNVFTTGFDAPNVDAGVIARPTKSLVLFSQMVGRMIRGPKTDGGTSDAVIVSVVDVELPGFKDSYNNWQDVWK